MADNQITPFQLTDQFTMDNFNQRINETNTALQNKAPAGFGLGENSTYANLISDCNLATKNGWYWTYENVQNAPMDYGFLHVCCSSAYIKQEWWSTGTFGVLMAIRVCNDGTWMPWEWVNPLMQLGGEYRTTERHQRKPVYVKRIVLDALAIGTESQSARTDIDGGLFTNVCETLVRHDMFVYPSSGGAMFRIPFINDQGKIKAIGSMNQSNVSTGDTWLYGSIYTFDDLSAYKAMVTCWYTKTTD